MSNNGKSNGHAANGAIKDAYTPPAPECANRWEGVQRPYSAQDVAKLQGSLKVAHTLATHGANKLWKLMNEEPYVPALGALTGNQAMQQIRAGLKAIYCSGWQVGLFLAGIIDQLKGIQ